MSLEELVHDVESRLADLGRRLLEPGPKTLLREQVDALTAELNVRQGALARCKAERDAAARRMLDNHIASARLKGQIESCIRHCQPDQAWQHALELDAVRQKMAEDRAALPRHDQACWSLQFKIRQLERKLSLLRAQLDQMKA